MEISFLHTRQAPLPTELHLRPSDSTFILQKQITAYSLGNCFLDILRCSVCYKLALAQVLNKRSALTPPLAYPIPGEKELSEGNCLHSHQPETRLLSSS